MFQRRRVSAVTIDPVVEPRKDDPEDPSHWDRHPGFAKFPTKKQTYTNVPVKFVKSSSGEQETFEIRNVSIEIDPPVDVDQIDADSTNKKWDRYPGQRRNNVGAVILDVPPVIQKDQPEVVKKWDRYPNTKNYTISQQKSRRGQRTTINNGNVGL